MEFLCIGLSHQSAPVSVRERLALGEEAQAELLRQLTSPEDEALLVSTCNRVEVYVAAGAPELTRAAIGEAISRIGGPEALAHLYEHRAEAALLHLFRVASSLDSMVLGEPQILGQVKDAYELARKGGSARGELSRACSAAFATAKQVRSETGIGRAATSMASAAVGLAEKVFGGLLGREVLLVGAGEMAEIAARHLKASGAKLTVCNRTLTRAEELAQQVGGVARPFEELPSLLVQADVVVCSTASPTPLFTREKVAAALKARRYRPLFMVDLAVPRDIAPEVNQLEGVYAYDVDDIQKVVADNTASRAAEAQRAEVIVAESTARFLRERALREGLPVLAQLRQRADQIARAEVERTLATFGDGLNEKQRKSIEAMASAIVNKLLHPPTAKLRSLGAEEERNRLAGATAELFGLGQGQREDPPEPEPQASEPGEAPPAAAGAKR